jgi:hypothetical protein
VIVPGRQHHLDPAGRGVRLDEPVGGRADGHHPLRRAAPPRDGRPVYYSAATGGTAVGGLVAGKLYRVLVIDATTIKLQDPSVTLSR